MKQSFLKFKKEFGFKFAYKLYKSQILYKLTKNEKFMQKKHSLILNYLNKNYGDLLVDSATTKNISKDAKVWVFWWQGINETTPKIVQACVQSIKQNFSKNEVVLLTKENYKNYASIPEYITKKVEGGEITLTHFSDILRANLLNLHGGVWLDATIFLTNQIIDDISKCNFYTNKLNEKSIGQEFVSKGKWSAFFLAGNSGDAIFANLQNIFFEYWKTHHMLITYFLIDYTLKLMFDKCPKIKEQIESVPYNNENIYLLSSKMFENENNLNLVELLNSSKIFKLTYKFNKEKTEQKNTIYKKLIGE